MPKNTLAFRINGVVGCQRRWRRSFEFLKRIINGGVSNEEVSKILKEEKWMRSGQAIKINDRSFFAICL